MYKTLRASRLCLGRVWWCGSEASRGALKHLISSHCVCSRVVARKRTRNLRVNNKWGSQSLTIPHVQLNQTRITWAGNINYPLIKTSLTCFVIIDLCQSWKWVVKYHTLALKSFKNASESQKIIFTNSIKQTFFFFNKTIYCLIWTGLGWVFM